MHTTTTRATPPTKCTHTKASLVAVFHLSALAVFFTYRIFTTGQLWSGAAEVTVGMATAVASISLLVGLRMENRLLVSSYIFFQSAAIFVLFILFLLLILGYKTSVFATVDDDGVITTEKELLIVCQIFLTLVIISIELWFLSLVWKSYRYLDEQFVFTGMNRIANV